MAAASAYFAAWRGVELKWASLAKYPVPKDWLTIRSRRSTRTPWMTNWQATHPVNAMLNYAYAVLCSQVQIEAAAQGYDPRRGIMHFDRAERPALVLDLMEPCRPVVDRQVLNFFARSKLTGGDFLIMDDGVCRLAPQMARRICEVIST